jgi:hypothetical protein
LFFAAVGTAGEDFGGGVVYWVLAFRPFIRAEQQ